MRTWGGRTALLLLMLALPASGQPAQHPVLEPDRTPLLPPLVVTGAPTPLDSEPQAPTSSRPSTVVRVGAELGGSLVGSVALGVTGALGAGVWSLAMCNSHENSRLGLLGLSTDCFASSAIVGGVAGVAVGMPLGVWWGGKRAGGNGGRLGAFGGLGVSLASAGAARLLGAKDVSNVLLATAPVLSIVGYELTDSAPLAPAAPGVTPALSVSSGGASFGLQGRF